jgi:RHS repeat-associated protein
MSSKNTSPDPPGKNIFLTSSFAGSYDGVGNLASYTDSVMGTWNFSYDSLNRLVSSQNTAASSATPQFAGNYGCWSYDAFGNRLSQAVSTTPCNGTPPLTSWATYNASNQFTATSAAPGGVPYDPAGNVTNDGVNQYLYDGEGRICAVASTPIPGMTAMTGYLYDANGTRVAKGSISVWSCDPAVNGFQTTSDYILGPGGEQVTEMAMDANNSMAWQHTNVYAAGSLLATYDNDGLHFYLNDPLGTRRAQTDYAGVLEQTCSSLPFGDGLSCSGGNLQSPTEHHFTGKERDTESGNDYFGARYYSSSFGRFMSSDPMNMSAIFNFDDPQAWNGYSYAHNNPLRFTDPKGETYQVCDSNGQNCSTMDDKTFEDDEAKDRKNGEYFQTDDNGNGTMFHIDADGNHVTDGTFKQTSVDAPGLSGPANLAGAQFLYYQTRPVVNAIGMATVGEIGVMGAVAAAPIVTGVARWGLQRLATEAVDAELKQVTEMLYQATDEIPGGTAGAVRSEIATGQYIEASNHIIKAGEMVTKLTNMIQSGRLSGSDLMIAAHLLSDVKNSLGR